MNGGYYATMIDGVLVISINGMYPFTKNELEKEKTHDMFLWLKRQLDLHNN